ncbi:uncharacterized protein UTRI_04131 [Ustilago trichophora]|uniref:Uncharacterized protein n=1 Tax=Ustilago trichophora TaxID=86804 RepID=A0A5C3E7P7_9BASI|nr:uncharacterized protein UTRI_04131 [Ustilago trichophora]
MQCAPYAVRAVQASMSTRGLALTGLRSLSSQSQSQSPSPSSCEDKRILVKPLPHASLDKFAGGFFAPNKSNPSHHCADFSVILKPFPRHLTDANGRLDETKLLPHWLPLPPHPSTHQGRHLRPPFYYPTLPCLPDTISKEAGQDADRWEPLAQPRETSKLAGDSRPILRFFVMSTKKRIHKLAVIRHRTRTRLVTALRMAIVRLQESDPGLGKSLELRKNVLVLIASPLAYAKAMPVLVDEMETAVRRITTNHNRRGPPRSFNRASRSNPSPSFRNHSNQTTIRK